MEIAGRNAVVTGASSGIGRAIARALAERGANVALVARDGAALGRAAAEIPRAQWFAADVTDVSSATALIGRIEASLGPTDILVNNAGRGMMATLESLDLDALRALFELNTFAAVALMQAVIPGMRSRATGAIVNVSSGTSLERYPGLGGYAASKAALNALSLSARAELASDGIVVGLVYPGPTATAFAERSDRGAAPAISSEADHPDLESPEAVAATVLDAIRRGTAESLTANLARFGTTTVVRSSEAR